MAIERKTVVDQVEVNRNGTIGVRLCLLLVDGDEEINSRYHRTVIDNTVTVEAQMGAVNQHLALMGEKPVSDEDLAQLAVVCAAAGHEYVPVEPEDE